MSTYIVNKRFKSKCLSGEINLPYGTRCECEDNLITYKGRPICYATSQNAYDYFSSDDDGNGTKRGDLINAIRTALAKADDKHQARWDKIWDDEDNLGKYRRQDNPDHWLWNFDFYNAPIEDLQYIYNKIKEVR